MTDDGRNLFHDEPKKVMVELIVSAPARPGGQVVQWSTDAFNVRDGAGRTHGKCGIATFARWAKVRLT